MQRARGVGLVRQVARCGRREVRVQFSPADRDRSSLHRENVRADDARHC